MRTFGILALVAVALMGMWTASYGQPYEPEHIWHRCGEDSGDWFGKTIAGIGDVNGDGCEDFLLSDKASGSSTEGHLLLFYGGHPPDSTADIVFSNPYPYDYYGREIENAGDVNGDHNDDFAAVGVYPQDNLSRVFIYFGGGQLDTIPDVVLSELTITAGYGANVEGVGDVNGDGYSDIAVFAANYGNGRGKVWIYFGGNPMDSIADWEREGLGDHNWFGQDIAGKGDLNGDGYDDFAIYEWTGYPNLAQTNYYVFYGDSELDTIPDLVIDGEEYYPDIDIGNSSAIADLNGDPYSDLVLTAGRSSVSIVFLGGNPMNTEIDLVLEGFSQAPPTYVFNIEVERAGDVNRDGYDDLLFSQTNTNLWSKVYVFLGSPLMWNEPYIEWYSASQGIGTSLTDCGDINGDGVDDIMFGSWDDIFNSQGCVDIWLGDTTFVASVPEESSYLIPQNFRLLPPYPNPFNSSVTIPFEIVPGSLDGFALKIYNVLGQEVTDLTAQARRSVMDRSTGHLSVTWNAKDPAGRDLGSGIYLIELQRGSHRQVQKAIMLR